MAVKSVSLQLFLLVVTYACYRCQIVTANQTLSTKCQVVKPLRKQMNVEPLNGLCLHDIVNQVSETLRSIGNEELGLTFFQEIIDSQEFTSVRNDLNDSLKQLVDKLTSKLNSYLDLLSRSNVTIHSVLLGKQTYGSYPRTLRNSDLCSHILEALASSMRGKEWKHLHVLVPRYPEVTCGQSGLARNIGTLLMSRCTQPKRVVLLLDHGVFSPEHEINPIQEAAKLILEMMTDSDYVSAMRLVEEPSLYCEGRLLRATDLNKNRLIKFMEGVVRSDSNRTVDLNLQRFTRNFSGNVFFVHLTNTDSADIKELVDAAETKSARTYFRTVLISLDTKLQGNTKTAARDRLVIFPSQNNLPYELARLFQPDNCTNNSTHYHLSEPYFHPDRKSMVVSVGQISRDIVLSLDVSLRDFAEDVTYFDAGPNTYAILFDENLNVLTHTNFPRPEVISEQPLRVSLSSIENIQKTDALKMLREPEGCQNVTTTTGLTKELRWRKLDYGGLIVCLVSHETRKSFSIAKSNFLLPPNILHHRLDLLLQSVIDKDTLCSHHNRIMALHTGVVYLSPWCFQSPMEQLRLLETGSAMTVQSYMAYIKDSTRLLANPGLHPSVRPDVALLSKILTYFESRHAHSSLNKYVVRRYAVATRSGVMEVFPGTVLNTGLDPKRRAWYGNALAHPGKLVLTSPYLDPGGAGFIVTVSHTISEGRSGPSSSTSGSVLAVVSMDVTMGYVTKLLLDMYPFCEDSQVMCFLVDDKGYLVSHPSMFDAPNKVEQQHLTHKELMVANDILNHEFFVEKKVCASHLDGTVQRYYQFNTSLEEVLTNIVYGEHCVKYQVAVVPGTNVFLGVVNATCIEMRAFCPCSTTDRLCLNCQRMEQTDCECPCECPLHSDGCTPSSVEGLEPCPIAYEQGPGLQASWPHGTSLKTCPTFDCDLYETASECLGVIGCQWCYLDRDAETPLQSPGCSDQTSCFKGILGSPVPFGDGTYNSHSTEELSRDWPSVGPLAGGILALILALGVMLYCYRLRSVQPGVEHQCLHLHAAPDTLRMSHLEGDAEPTEIDPSKNNLDSLLRDGVAPISPYRVSTNYRRPPGGDSDHGYSTMTPHDDSEQQTFAEPLLVVGGSRELDLGRQNPRPPSPTTRLGSPHHVLAPVTVHRNMETNYC